MDNILNREAESVQTTAPHNLVIDKSNYHESQMLANKVIGYMANNLFVLNQLPQANIARALEAYRGGIPDYLLKQMEALV